MPKLVSGRGRGFTLTLLCKLVEPLAVLFAAVDEKLHARHLGAPDALAEEIGELGAVAVGERERRILGGLGIHRDEYLCVLAVLPELGAGNRDEGLVSRFAGEE